MKYVRCYLGVLALNMLAAWIVYQYFPDLKFYLLEEDGLIENLSAFFFLLTFFVALFLAARKKEKRTALFLVSAAGLLGFLDEVSFGERLFTLSFPIIDNVKIDSVHDLYEFGYFQTVKLLPAHAIALYPALTLAAFGLALLLWWRRTTVRVNLSMTLSQAPSILILTVALLLISAVFIDLVGSLEVRGFQVPYLIHGTFFEEILEMNVGIGLLFCSLSLYDSSSQPQAGKPLAAARSVDRISASQFSAGLGLVSLAAIVLGIYTWYVGGHHDTEMLWTNSENERPRSWASHYLQANTLSSRGELKEAVQHYRRALELNPDNAVTHFDLGNVLMKQGQFKEAEDQLRRAVKLKPDFAEAHESLGRSLTRQGRADEAIQYYEEAVRLMSPSRDASETRY